MQMIQIFVGLSSGVLWELVIFMFNYGDKDFFVNKVVSIFVLPLIILISDLSFMLNQDSA